MHQSSENGGSPSKPYRFLHDIIRSNAESCPAGTALRFKGETYSYKELVAQTTSLSKFLSGVGVKQNARVAVFLPNCPEAVISAIATFEAGGIFVPVNPLYRPRQVEHVLNDCAATVLVTTRYLFASIADRQQDLAGLSAVIFADPPKVVNPLDTQCEVFTWSEAMTRDAAAAQISECPRAMSDPAMIFYTSGSSGRPKGVLVSHLNIVDGARIVSGYLDNSRQDRVLAALPLSFDYGFSQVTTTLFVGAELIVTNYSLPQTLLTELSQNKVTGLAGVPTMWAQLATLKWPEDISSNLRYITNSGGRLPRTTLLALRERLPDTLTFLMYGLTEAFRSTYLDPALVDEYPDSIGRAIPGVSLHVLKPNGEPCDTDEPGELVHSGALVSLGYWNNPDASARVFRELPANLGKDNDSVAAVWTGDIVRQDRNGNLYFVERADNMLKCSGYRISPTEIEEVIFESGLVEQVVAVGIPDEYSGHRIGIVIVPRSAHEENDFAIRHICARELPPYMQPDEIRILESLPMTANGKPDRLAVSEYFRSGSSTQAI